MKPAPFDYVRAETVEEALAVLAAEGSDAAVVRTIRTAKILRTIMPSPLEVLGVGQMGVEIILRLGVEKASGN